MIQDLKAFATELGKTPTKRDIDEYGPHYAKLYQNEFGSWNAAIEAANLKPNLIHDISQEELLDDIERVAGVLGKTPTLDEMDRFGKYSGQTYKNKLDSFVESLERLGLQPSQSQYNFSKKEAPPELQATKNVRKLRNDGPSPASELPLDSTGASDKRHGLAKFSINTGRTGQGQAEPIYYLFGDDKPEIVIRKFFEVNPQILENRTRKAITEEVGGNGKEWASAIRLVLDDLGVES